MTKKYLRKNTIAPLNNERLRSLALFYVGKYATSRKKLSQYLSRKVKEKGWDDAIAPQIEVLADEFSKLGYIDDSGYAASKARSLVNRGYGVKRLEQEIFVGGIEIEDQAEAMAIIEENRLKAADNYARKKRIGPYAREEASREQKQKQLAAFLRAGHDIKIAQKFVNADSDDIIDWEI